MTDDSTISSLLANERDLSRTVLIRIFAPFFPSKPLRTSAWVLFWVSNGLIFDLLADHGRIIALSPVLSLLDLAFGWSWVCAWVEWRKLQKVRANLALFPAIAVAENRTKFEKGGPVTANDWLKSLSWAGTAAIFFLAAWNMWNAGNAPGATFAAIGGASILAVLVYSHRPWKTPSNS